LENLSSQSTVAEKIGQNPDIIPWLHNRIQLKERKVSQNKQYAAEMLAILLQISEKSRIRSVELGVVDTLLQILSIYRKIDPEKDSDEEEYVENLFDCLTCLVDEASGKEKFVEGEGIELAQIMLREGKMSKPRALRVLSHALSGKGATGPCERLVEAAGLKTVFGMFMKKVNRVFCLFQLSIPKLTRCSSLTENRWSTYSTSSALFCDICREILLRVFEH
jgi:beta-catenin-like protein 1